jgi:hypothetical protein
MQLSTSFDDSYNELGTPVQVGSAVVCGDASAPAPRWSPAKGMTLQCSTLLANSRLANSRVSNYTNASSTNISLADTHRNRYCDMVLVRDEAVARVFLPVAMPVAAGLEPFVTAALRLLRSSGRIALPERAAVGNDNVTSTCPSHSWWDFEERLPWRQKLGHLSRTRSEWEVAGVDVVALLSSMHGLMAAYVVALLLMLLGLVIGCMQAVFANLARCRALCKKSPCCGGGSEDVPVLVEPPKRKATNEDKWPKATLEEVRAIKVGSPIPYPSLFCFCLCLPPFLLPSLSSPLCERTDILSCLDCSQHARTRAVT